MTGCKCSFPNTVLVRVTKLFLQFEMDHAKKLLTNLYKINGNL